MVQKESYANLQRLEQICRDFPHEQVIAAVRRDAGLRLSCAEFFDQCANDANVAKLEEIRLLIAVALTIGNPLFEKIPDIIKKADAATTEDGQ